MWIRSQDRIYQRKDQIRLQAEITEDLNRGDIASAERRLRTNDKTAAPATAEDYRDLIDRAQKDGKYGEHIASATAQMVRGDYQAALVSVNHARKLRNGQEVDDLQKRIYDRRDRDEWINSGNKAMIEKDYATALDHFQKANRLESSPEIEKAVRQANGLLLLKDATEKLNVGDILMAQQIVKNSIWSFPTEQAKAMLTSMGPAVAAAEQERQADQDADRGQFDDAIAKYERARDSAILPVPAEARMSQKLAKAQRARIVAKADELYQSRDYGGALAGYLEAQKLGKEDPEIEARILKARQRMGR